MKSEKNVRYFLEKYKIMPKKKMGQNFLVDRNIIKKEVALAMIRPHDVVLEIGPGLGFLTRELLLHAKKVIAIELDKELAEILKKELGNKRLEIICADALDVNFPEFDMCVSNIPYEISSKIVLKLGKCKKPATLIMQKEFAERITARPGSRSYSKISVMAQYYFNSKILHIVSKTSFFPSPKVDSAIVGLFPHDESSKKSLEIFDEGFFFKTVHALFQHKNMSVRNALIHSRGEFGLDKERAKAIAGAISLKSAKVRTLDMQMISKCAKEISELC